MAINKLPEFAKDGQKNTDDLVLTDGFPVSKKPARQWFNYLFNMLSLKINEIIESDPVTRSEIIDNLTTNDATKPLSAKQGKDLQDNKLGKTENAASAAKLQIARTISFSGAATGSFNFDGSSNSSAVLTLANSGVVAGTYGTTLQIPVVTVNAKGLISTITTQDIPAASTSAKGLVQLVNDLTTGGTDKAITAEQVKLLFKMFEGGTNYIQIPNPLDASRPYIIQWGVGIAQTGSDNIANAQTINFPIIFPNNCLNVSLSTHTASSNCDAIFQISAITNSGFKAFANLLAATNGIVTPYFFAIGN